MTVIKREGKVKYMVGRGWLAGKKVGEVRVRTSL
jgi:hypothetical protein